MFSSEIIEYDGITKLLFVSEAREQIYNGNVDILGFNYSGMAICNSNTSCTNTDGFNRVLEIT